MLWGFTFPIVLHRNTAEFPKESGSYTVVFRTDSGQSICWEPAGSGTVLSGPDYCFHLPSVFPAGSCRKCAGTSPYCGGFRADPEGGITDLRSDAVTKSRERKSVEPFVTFVNRILVFTYSCLSFYSFTLASHLFRKEFKSIVIATCGQRWCSLWMANNNGNTTIVNAALTQKVKIGNHPTQTFGKSTILFFCLGILFLVHSFTLHKLFDHSRFQVGFIKLRGVSKN
jgi:hypothetical protein